MKQTAIVIAPGRGTYNRDELGYYARHHADRSALMQGFDDQRKQAGQVALRDLDGAKRYSGARFARGDNASGLIYACALADFLSIDRDRFDILGVTGNSMGWYTALACAGSLGAMDGFTLVNTMGTLMHRNMIGGQLIYPFVDENWVPIAGLRAEIETKMSEIDTRAGHVLRLSIDLGGMLVLAGNHAGLSAFEEEIPALQGRYPMRLAGHAGFHSALQAEVAKAGQARLAPELFRTPDIPMIDGRGAIWRPKSSRPAALRDYTLGHQVTETYDFTAAVRVSAREFMPDVFIVLGPGTTLGGAIAQSLVATKWRGMTDKADFKAAQHAFPRLLAMGHPAQRNLVQAPMVV